MENLIWVGLVMVVLALVFSGKLRTLAKGFLSKKAEDIAKTPEGAESVFVKAIEEAQDDYAKADDNLRKVAGQLNSAKISKDTAENEIKSLDNKIQVLIKQDRTEDAVLLAEKREGVLADIEMFASQITKLEALFEDAQLIHTNMQQSLETLKKDKKNVVTQLKMNQQMEQMYDNMDALKNKKPTDKLVSVIKEKVVEGNDTVAGAKIAHKNKLSTRLEDIEISTQKANAMGYIESLKNK